MTTRVAVIGLGSMGQRHLKACASHPAWKPVLACTRNPKTRKAVEEEYGIGTVADFRDIRSEDVDAVVIAVPTSLHGEVATYFLEQGIHVLLEKPIAGTEDEATNLIELADSRNLVLQIGHIERFNPAWQAGRTWWKEAVGHPPHFVEAYRMSPFDPRIGDVGVTLDLMIHDVDLVLDLFESEGAPKVLSAQTLSLKSAFDDLCMSTLEMGHSSLAKLTASRVAEERGRAIVVRRDDKELFVNFFKREAFFRDGNGEREPLPVAEIQPLELQLTAFSEAIRKGDVQVDGRAGLRALATCLAILEKAGV